MDYLFGSTQNSSTVGISSDFNGVAPNSDTSRVPPLRLSGSNAISPNSDVSKATPNGGLFYFNAMSTSDHNSRVSSTGNSFGTTAKSDASTGTSRSSTSFSELGSSRRITSKAPSAKGLFRKSDGRPSSNSSTAPSANSPFGFTSITDSRSTSKPTTSTAPSVFTSEDSPLMDSFSSNRFHASYWLNKGYFPVHQSPSPPSAPTPKSCSPQAREARSTSPETAAVERTALADKTRPAATRNGVCDGTQTGD